MNARLMLGEDKQISENCFEFANLKKIFNVVKFRRAYVLERSLFQTTKEGLLIITEKNSDPNQILMRRVLAFGERVYNLMKKRRCSQSPRSRF